MFAIALVVLHTLTAPALSYARDAQYEYLGTTDGLWRMEPLQRIAFPGQRVTALAVRDGKLYVGKQPTIEQTSADHTLVVSADHGVTFTPLDDSLRDCTLDCGFMAVHQIAVDGDRLFINAGGNVLVSPDDGATWTNLFPSPAHPAAVQTCPLQFLPIGTTMLLGGECPLDIGWLGRLVNGEVQRLRIDDIENRNVQFIRPLGGVIYAGVEGGLLRSDDGGATFRWSVRYALDNPRYPYITQLVRTNVVAAGGFDKGAGKAYLIWSADEGRSWSDASALFGATAEAVTLLFQDRDGRMLAAVTDGGQAILYELSLQGGAAGRRRSVAP
jgi:hypothetical protein